MNAFRTAAVALIATLAVASQSRAADPGVLSGIVRNDTNMTVNYQYRIDNGAWTSLSLAPGQSHTFSMPFSGANLNRVTAIRFDHVLGDNVVTNQNTTLVRYSCKTPDQGWMQRFIVTNDGKNLALAR